MTNGDDSTLIAVRLAVLTVIFCGAAAAVLTPVPQKPVEVPDEQHCRLMPANVEIPCPDEVERRPQVCAELDGEEWQKCMGVGML